MLIVLLSLNFQFLLLLLGRWRYEDLNWDVLWRDVLSVALVLLDLVADFRRNIFQVGRQSTAIGVLVLIYQVVSCHLRVVLLTYLLCFGRTWRRMLQNNIIRASIIASLKLGLTTISWNVFLASSPMVCKTIVLYWLIY